MRYSIYLGHCSWARKWACPLMYGPKWLALKVRERTSHGILGQIWWWWSVHEVSCRPNQGGSTERAAQRFPAEAPPPALSWQPSAQDSSLRSSHNISWSTCPSISYLVEMWPERLDWDGETTKNCTRKFHLMCIDWSSSTSNLFK